jgi:hypothetical protein
MAMACHNCYSCNSHWMSRLGWRMLNTWKEMMAMLHLFRAENAMWFTMIHHDSPIAVGCFWSQGIPSTPGLGHMGPQVLAIHTDFVYVTSKQALRQTEPVLHLNYKLFEYVISPYITNYCILSTRTIWFKCVHSWADGWQPTHQASWQMTNASEKIRKSQTSCFEDQWFQVGESSSKSQLVGAFERDQGGL